MARKVFVARSNGQGGTTYSAGRRPVHYTSLVPKRPDNRRDLRDIYSVKGKGSDYSNYYQDTVCEKAKYGSFDYVPSIDDYQSRQAGPRFQSGLSTANNSAYSAPGLKSPRIDIDARTPIEVDVEYESGDETVQISYFRGVDGKTYTRRLIEYEHITPIRGLSNNQSSSRAVTTTDHMTKAR